jgi:multiple sugar transport system substrate-binding protein
MPNCRRSRTPLGGLVLALCGALALAPTPAVSQGKALPNKAGADTTVVKLGGLVPPLVVAPCAKGSCRFEGQTVTVLVSGGNTISRPIHELRGEFEAATGARLRVVELMIDEHFSALMSDLSTRAGRFDVSMAGAWWLGGLVEGKFLHSYDRWLGDKRFPAWDLNDVLPGPRKLLGYGGRHYMVANDHDGQILYYRRDLFEDPVHQKAYAARYGKPLGPPKTWDEFRDIAEYFSGRDLNGDGIGDHGMTAALALGAQAMFHFMSFSAPYVIGPTNPGLYWFDADSMRPLIDGPGHVRALEAFVGLLKFGPREMLDWDLGKSWDHFLAGRAAMTFSWGDLGALAQQEGSRVRGRIGAAPLPGTMAYYSVPRRGWLEVDAPNMVGNTTGGSWAGVISRWSKSPEAAYYLLSLMATKQKSLVYAARGWDGIDPGRRSHFLPPHGSASVADYLRLGWDESDVRGYLSAYAATFNAPLQAPYLRIPGTISYLQALDAHLAEAVRGQLSPKDALRAAAVDFEEITLRLGRDKQRRSYRASLGL